MAGLLEAWGEQGFARHLESLRLLYSRKANVLVEACCKHLKGKWVPGPFKYQLYRSMASIGMDSSHSVVSIG